MIDYGWFDSSRRVYSLLFEHLAVFSVSRRSLSANLFAFWHCRSVCSRIARNAQERLSKCFAARTAHSRAVSAELRQPLWISESGFGRVCYRARWKQNAQWSDCSTTAPANKEFQMLLYHWEPVLTSLSGSPERSPRCLTVSWMRFFLAENRQCRFQFLREVMLQTPRSAFKISSTVVFE